MWALVRDAVVALKAAVNCEAVNVGVNLGAAAGGSQSDHLHVHCVPRWVGDANFIAVAGETRVLPISLDDVYRSLSEVATWSGTVEP
jgi:ATP adenylyltransferase